MSYLGLDVGTSGTKGVVYDASFRLLAESSVSYERVCPRAGWYEIDVVQLGRAVRQVVAHCGHHSRTDPIRALACSVFGGGISALDAQLRPLLNIISTTDQRAQPQADEWSQRFGRERTYRITGTTTHASLMLPKVLWLQAHLEQPQRAHQFVTAAECVQACLGVHPRMDLATASTTMLLDIVRRDWSDEILAAAGILREQLPPLVSPGEAVDTLPASVCEELGLARGCVLIAGGHDQQVCALGAGLCEPGSATNSLGTVECITTLFEQPLLRDDLLNNNFSNLLHVHGGRIATLAYNFSAGDLLAWLSRTLGGGQADLPTMLAGLPEEPSRVLALPHFAGSGTPHLDAQSKGLLVGLTLQTSPIDIVRGAVDATNYEMRQNLDIWRRNGIAFDHLRSYGKGATSDRLLQIKADILELEIERLRVVETGCLGAALLAARGADPAFRIAEMLPCLAVTDRTFSPRARFAEQHQRNYELYRELYPQLRELLHRL